MEKIFDRKTTGNRIKETRKQLYKRDKTKEENQIFKSQKSLEEELNWAEQRLKKIESGHVDITVEELCQLSNVLKVDIDYLLGFIDTPTHEMQSVAELTGLNEYSIDVLVREKQYSNTDLQLLDALICSDELFLLSKEIFIEIEIQALIKRLNKYEWFIELKEKKKRKNAIYIYEGWYEDLAEKYEDFEEEFAGISERLTMLYPLDIENYSTIIAMLLSMEEDVKRRQWEISDLFMDFVKRFVKESEV